MLYSQSKTRWAFRKQAPEAVTQNPHHSTPKVASKADGLLSKLCTFKFRFKLVFRDILLQRAYILSNYPQMLTLLWNSLNPPQLG